MESKQGWLPRPQFSLRVRGMLVLAFPVLALLGAVASVLWLEGETQRADLLLRHAVDLRAQIQVLRSEMLDAETSAVAFSASGQSSLLEPYRRSAAHAAAAMKVLSTLAANGEEPSARMREIQGLVKRGLADFARLTDGTDGAGRRELLASHRIQHDRLNRLLQEMLGDVDRLVTAAGESRESHYKQFAMLALVCGVVGPFGGLLINLVLTNRIVRRVGQVGANAHRLASGQPLEPLPPGKDEIAVLAREISEAAVLLRARESRLSTSEKRYRDLFDQAPLPYHEAGPDGLIHRVNLAESKLLGYQSGDMVGRAVWEFVAPEERDATRDRLLEAVREGRDQPPIERDYVLADGTRITVEIHENLVRNEHGEVAGVRAALLDITEHKVAVMAARKVEQYAQELRSKNDQLGRAAAAARAATEAKSRFLANMSHELRTPLNSIIGFSELMHDGKVGPVSEDHRDFLSDILTSSRHLLQLINDILDISKIESGKFEFRPERCDLAGLASEVCGLMRPLAEKKRLDMRDESGGPLLGQIDPARFKQVLYNFVSNAIKFTPAGGRVIVRLKAEGESRCRVEVEDSGPGISAEDQTRLFAEFEQLAMNRKEGQGTGLGLALTKRLVEGQGGSVGVRSAPGEGSLFYAVLPVAWEEKYVDSARSHRPRSVLVVEDTPQDSRWLCQILREAGYAVETARTQADAISQAHARVFDAITLDLVLPDGTGWEVLHEIRSGGLNRSTPVVVVSMAAEKDTAHLFPIQDFLAKPVVASDLVQAMERAGVPPYRNRTVLVVDDDPAMLRLVQATLGGLGYRAVCRQDGQAGLLAVSQERPSIVLLDLMMPVMDGFQFLAKLRGDASLPHPPVIVWTNKDLSTAEQQHLKGLADMVIAKQDCTPKALIERLRSMVG